MRRSSRPDIGDGGALEQFERYPVTYGVLAANLILFLFCAWHQHSLLTISPQILLKLGANQYRLVEHEPWRLVTSAFLHFGLLHVGFNSLALVYLGRIIEVHYGSARTWVIYVLALVTGAAASAGWAAWRHEPGVAPVSAGASAGTFGLLLLGYVYAQSAPTRLGGLARQLGSWITGAVVFSLLWGGVDHAAHAGGALAGALCGALIQPRPGQDASPVWAPLAHALALLCLGCFAAVVWTLRQHGRGF